jgi:hypothetical protein
MAPIALTDAQLDQVTTPAYQVPRALRDMYLQAVAERLRGKPFDDADVWRAAVAAMREILVKARAAHQSSAGLAPEEEQRQPSRVLLLSCRPPFND